MAVIISTISHWLTSAEELGGWGNFMVGSRISYVWKQTSWAYNMVYQVGSLEVSEQPPLRSMMKYRHNDIQIVPVGLLHDLI